MTFTDDIGVFTPYSTVKPLLGEEMALWAPELDRDRIASYQKYEEIYWSHSEAFRLVLTGDTGRPVYVPNPRTICDTTSHFLLKGLRIQAEKEGSKMDQALQAFLDREIFMAKFNTAKHSGVVRGDFILHITADPLKAPLGRVSINSVDPAAYFPEFDDDDLDRVTAVNLVEQIIDPDDPTKVNIRRLRYEYVGEGETRSVSSQEAVYEVRDWWLESRVRITSLSPPHTLPPQITTIPVYHFKNIDWQGQPFGSSELRGYESIQTAINQSTSDEDVALALEGLGVYATDAPKPTDDEGNEEEWSIAPGRVVEVPATSYFKRITGVENVKPFQDHLKFLVDSLYEASGTFRGGTIDAAVAESGIALAIRFLPTMAKLEERDEQGVGKLTQLFFDWKAWYSAYEGMTFGEEENILIALGDKLPSNKNDILNMLNNALDRKTISREFYRQSLAELYGISFPDDMEAQILAEQERLAPFQPPPPGGNGSQSNNISNPNESGGTEATQPVKDQVKVQ